MIATAVVAAQTVDGMTSRSFSRSGRPGVEAKRHEPSMVATAAKNTHKTKETTSPVTQKSSMNFEYPLFCIVWIRHGGPHLARKSGHKARELFSLPCLWRSRRSTVRATSRQPHRWNPVTDEYPPWTSWVVGNRKNLRPARVVRRALQRWLHRRQTRPTG